MAKHFIVRKCGCEDKVKVYGNKASMVWEILQKEAQKPCAKHRKGK